MALKETQTALLKAQIKRGLVLHIDPDFLMLHYGDITTGFTPKSPVGARYAICVGVEDNITFWSLLTTNDRDNNQIIPDRAKEGPWADNGKTSYMNMTQLWVMTREMACEAHFVNNTFKSALKQCSVKPHMVDAWPAIPATYPKNFVKKALGPDAVVEHPAPKAAANRKEPVIDVPAPVPPPAEEPFNFRVWLREIRGNRTMRDITEASNGVLTQAILSVMETGNGNRIFSAEERDLWAKIVGVEGDPHLELIPVLTAKELSNRLAIRAGRNRTGQSKPVTPLISMPAMGSLDRQGLADRVARMISNSRLTDSEVQTLVHEFEQKALNILMGAMA